MDKIWKPTDYKSEIPSSLKYAKSHAPQSLPTLRYI